MLLLKVSCQPPCFFQVLLILMIVHDLISMADMDAAAALPPPPFQIPAEHLLLEVFMGGVQIKCLLIPRARFCPRFLTPFNFRLWAETVIYGLYLVVRSTGRRSFCPYVLSWFGSFPTQLPVGEEWRASDDIDEYYIQLRNRLIWQNGVGQWFEFRNEDWERIGLVGSRIILSPGTQISRIYLQIPAAPPAGPTGYHTNTSAHS